MSNLICVTFVLGHQSHTLGVLRVEKRCTNNSWTHSLRGLQREEQRLKSFLIYKKNKKIELLGWIYLINLGANKIISTILRLPRQPPLRVGTAKILE